MSGLDLIEFLTRFAALRRESDVDRIGEPDPWFPPEEERDGE